MIVRPDDLAERDRYKILIGSVLPRPIAWVSSMDRAGNLNLAPYKLTGQMLFSTKRKSRPLKSTINKNPYALRFTHYAPKKPSINQFKVER